jgi:CheY-like chemotaxis protein
MRADTRAGTALVVEDEALVRCAIVALLHDHDWLVLEASAGEDALDFLGHPIDVIFTDIQLAGTVSGWDVAEAGREANPAVNVIYTSGNTTNRSRSVERSLFFEKPYEPDRVIAACQEFVVQSSRARGGECHP